MPFYPLPTSLPLAEAQHLLGYLRGQTPPVGQSIHAAWVLAGYAASQFIKDGTVPPNAASMSADFDLETELERVVNTKAGDLALIDWKGMFYSIVMEVLKKLRGG